jgi:glyoxylase-like metal-dependent hydrolase (beta-lactamase superfamily II)
MSEFGPDMPPYTELSPGVRRIVAPNPSMMTGPGTNTYLFGIKEIAVLDPGPNLDVHLDDIRAKAGGDIRWILATHSHPDHSPGVAPLAELTGAEVLGMTAPNADHNDRTFVPSRVLSDGDKLETDEFVIEAIHTPGHASNHLCYRHIATNWIFTGDHVIDGSTVVINPPDGNMTHYLDSLEKLKAMQPVALMPGHGERIDDSGAAIDWIIQHRLEREAKVLAAVKANPHLTTRELVPYVYEDIPEKLYEWAERSLQAHLMRLEADLSTTLETGRWKIL